MNVEKDKKRDWIETFYRDLHELAEPAFPKRCTKCGKVYTGKAQFIAETAPVKDITLTDHSGLFSLEGGPVDNAIGLFRNCACGSTLMADFRDRRDNSERGRQRREQFDSLMDRLHEHGMTMQESREALLTLLHGGHSERIEKLLGDIKLS